MGYIDWFNHRRLHGEITEDNGYVTPAEFEAAYYRQTHPPSRRLPNSEQSRNPGRFMPRVAYFRLRAFVRARGPANCPLTALTRVIRTLD